MSTLTFPGARPDAEVNKKVRIKTNQGDIVIQVDPKAGPLAASNFVYLVENAFYNGTIFHRVIPDFMIQGGDPTGTGTGGPGYKFDNDEVADLPVKDVTIQGNTLHAPVYEKGTVAMANAGANTNGSQFFIMVGDYPLPPDYSIFGHVVEGQDVADKISALPRDPSDRPNAEVKMEIVAIEE
jgi:cyclophilin family peptidyl-prolyl cis-trans isomerase